MTELPKNVKIAKTQDEERIYQYLRMLHAENSMSALSEKKGRSMIHNLLNGGGIVGIIEGKNGIEASIGINFAEVWYSDKIHLDELWNFVHPAHRKSPHAKTLIEFAKYCAEKFNMIITIGIMTLNRTEAKVRLYQRLLTPIGATFLYVPPALEKQET